MRQDRIFAQILLILSVANVALTAPAIVRQRHLDVAKAASGKRAPAPPGSESLDNGATEGNLPPKSPSPMPPHAPIWAWLEGAGSGPPSPASTPEWPEPVSPPANRIIPGQEQPKSPSPPATHISIPAQWWLEPPSPPGNRIIPAQGEWRSLSFSDSSTSLFSGHPLLPPYGGSAASGANRFISDSLKHKLLVTSGVAGILVGAGGLAYGIHQWLKQPYVSPFSCGPPTEYNHSEL